MKLVTVLFCDIVGSTPLSERLGPEAMRDLVSSFLEASLAEVRRLAGDPHRGHPPPQLVREHGHVIRCPCRPTR